MTPKEFRRWRLELDLTQEEAALALGISRGTVINYESGMQRGIGGRPAPIPKAIELACEALANRAGIPLRWMD